MATVVSYQRITLPDGSPGTIITYDNGLTETVDANHQRVGAAGYAGATPLAPMGLASGQPPTGAAYDYASGWNQYGSRLPAQPANQMPSTGGYGGGGGGNPFQSSSTNTGGFGSAPQFQDGSLHPLQGGSPRVPGGTYRGPSGGGDGGTGQQQVFVPGGAAAGPYDTSAAANWPTQARRAFDASGRAYASRGSHTSPLYEKFAAKGNAMEAKVRGMAAKIQGGGASGGASGGAPSYGGDGHAAYAKQDHAATQAARQQQQAYEDGSYLYDTYKMRGFSKKMDPQQAEALMFRPSMLLPKVAPGLSPTSPRYGDLVDLPASQLAMLRYGAHGKAKDGPSQFTNNLAKFYDEAAGSGNLPSYDQLTNNLATAKKRSPLGAMFNKQPLGYGADNYESMVTSIFGSTALDPRVAAARTETTQGLIDQYGSQMLTKKAKKAKPINRWVAQRSSFL